MNNSIQEQEDITDTKNWNKAVPEEIPSPTYMPFFLAMGFGFLCWGILAGWVIAAAGLLIIIVSLSGWIKILRNEGRRK